MLRSNSGDAPPPDSRVLSALRHVLIWAPVVVLGFYLKLSVLNFNGFPKLALETGRKDFSFTPVEKLTLFRFEFIVLLFVIPFALSLLACATGRFVQRLVITFISLFLIVILNFQIESTKVMGVFQNAENFWDALEWGMANTGGALGYVSFMFFFRVTTLAFLVLFFACAPTSMYERLTRSFLRLGRAPAAVLIPLALLLFTPLVIITVLSWLPKLPDSIYYRLAVADALAALSDSIPGYAASSLQNTTPEELQRQYQVIANAPIPSKGKHWGEASGYDVLFFIIETMPAAALRLDSDLTRFPALERLRNRSFIGLLHHTTYPLTIRALYSMFTSSYPPNSSTDVLQIQLKGELRRSGLAWSAAKAGYKTAVYGSGDAIVPRMRGTLQQMGFEKIEEFNMRPGEGSHGEMQWAKVQLEKDRAALSQMKDDIRLWAVEGKRYLAVYLPQISHGPWVEIDQSATSDDLMARGHGLARLQDGWLNELMQVLSDVGRLEKTLIVVAGDHGLRSTNERPGLPLDLMDSYTYQVPLLLYAPGILDRPNLIQYLTSHIDLQPSILDLLGLADARDAEQGSPVWDVRLADRKTFFWANLYHGMDGFYSSGRYYSLLRDVDIMRANNIMLFGPEQALDQSGADARQAKETIKAMDAVRGAWLKTFKSAPSKGEEY